MTQKYVVKAKEEQQSYFKESYDGVKKSKSENLMVLQMQQRTKKSSNLEVVYNYICSIGLDTTKKSRKHGLTDATKQSSDLMVLQMPQRRKEFVWSCR